MADQTNSKFATMGTDAAYAENISGAPSPNTKPVAKSGNAKGGAAEGATAAHRSVALERNGFKGAPQVTHSYPNSPEAAKTFRNVRLIPSAIGNRDFYIRRQYGQGV